MTRERVQTLAPHETTTQVFLLWRLPHAAEAEAEARVAEAQVMDAKRVAEARKEGSEREGGVQSFFLAYTRQTSKFSLDCLSVELRRSFSIIRAHHTGLAASRARRLGFGFHELL